jgi:RecA/RadA recombinase
MVSLIQEMAEELKFQNEGLIHIYGEKSSGKSTIALISCIDWGIKGYHSIYIDTNNEFSAIRAEEQIKEKIAEENIRVGKEEILRKISVFRPKNLREQTEIILNLQKYCSPKVKQIVVDDIITHYRTERRTRFEKRTKLDATQELAVQLAYLKRLTEEHKITALIINQITISKDEGGKIRKKAVGEVYVTSYTDVNIEIKRTRNKAWRKAEKKESKKESKKQRKKERKKERREITEIMIKIGKEDLENS